MIDLTKFKDYWKEILIVILCLTLVVGYVLHKNAVHESELQKAQMLTTEAMKNTNVLQNQLETNKKNADSIVDFFNKAQANKVQPVNYFTVQSPDVTTAAKTVQERINAKDPTLPPSALEKTDRTVVTPQPENKDYQVGVYKINLERNWGISTGYGVHQGDSYIPIELQRNYAKNKAVSAEIHLKPLTTEVTGYEVKHTWKVDKLFFGLF